MAKISGSEVKILVASARNILLHEMTPEEWELVRSVRFESENVSEDKIEQLRNLVKTKGHLVSRRIPTSG